MTRAFARGFQAAQWETEAQPATNPYVTAKSDSAKYWQRGFAAGSKALQRTA